MSMEPHEDIVNYLCRHCSAGAFVDKARVMVSHDFFCPLYSLNHRIRNAAVM